MTYTPPRLFIPNKQRTTVDPKELPVAFRTIERWVDQISVPTGGGGGGYASLTGPGQTTTPGMLIQAGGFQINDNTPGDGIFMNTTGGIFIKDTQTGGIYIDEQGPPDSGAFLRLSSTGEMHINNGNSVSYAGSTTSGMYILNTGWGNSGSDGLYITNQGDGGLFITDRLIAGGQGGNPCLGIYIAGHQYIGLLQGGIGNGMSEGIEVSNNTGQISISNFAQGGIGISNYGGVPSNILIQDNGNGVEIINSSSAAISLATQGPITFDTRTGSPTGGTNGSINLYAASSIEMQNFGTGNFHIQNRNLGSDLVLETNRYIVLVGIPTTNPGGTGRIWRNGTVLNIT